MPVFFVGYTFFGRVVHSIPVARRVQLYVAEVYSDFDLVVGRTAYSWKGGSFDTPVFCRNNRDISFSIWYTPERGIIDRFSLGEFWTGTLYHMLTPLLEDEFGEDFRRFYATVQGGLHAGMAFDKNADVRMTANIIISVPDTCPDTFAQAFRRYYEFISGLGFNFSQYQLIFRKTGVNSWVTVPAEYINDGLAEWIYYMRDNLNERGSFSDSDRSRNLRYWDRTR
jgi:hypothetical protein